MLRNTKGTQEFHDRHQQKPLVPPTHVFRLVILWTSKLKHTHTYTKHPGFTKIKWSSSSLLFHQKLSVCSSPILLCFYLVSNACVQQKSFGNLIWRMNAIERKKNENLLVIKQNIDIPKIRKYVIWVRWYRVKFGRMLNESLMKFNCSCNRWILVLYGNWFKLLRGKKGFVSKPHFYICQILCYE